MSTTSIIPGSLSAIAQNSGGSIAEAFIGADNVIIVDTSASMSAVDDAEVTGSWDEGIRQTGKTRYERACDELSKLQASLPSKIAVISFSSSAVFCPSGTPTFLHGNTGLAEALRFAQIADGCDLRFIVISDGDPDSKEAALAEAKKFESRIDTIYIGPEDGQGRSFLRRLAAASGGQYNTSAGAQDLANSVTKLLTTAGQP